MFSDFGYINKKHEHQWDFTDQPLVSELLLGHHGINDLGVQVSWLAPTPVYLLFGAEVFQGENENLYANDGGDVTDTNGVTVASISPEDGPRAAVGWVKLAPFQFDSSELQFGLSASTGKSQELHEQTDDENSHALEGDSIFWGGDIVYKYDSEKPYGQGDWVVQAEYIYRKKDMTVVGEVDKDTNAFESGASEVSNQDGYYLQATYGILPRWRTGLRWEQVGLINEEIIEGDKEKFDDSWRASAMVDFRPSEFSQIRFQVNNGDYATEEGTENVWEAFVQLTFSIGAHGAHAF